MDSRSVLIKLKTFVTDASSFRKRSASCCHQARYSCVFFRSFPRSIPIREKWETSLVLNEHWSRSSCPLLLVFYIFFYASAEISSSFMMLIVDILMPMNNMNSASCIFRRRKGSSLPIPLMFNSLGVMMIAAEWCSLLRYWLITG